MNTTLKRILCTVIIPAASLTGAFSQSDLAGTLSSVKDGVKEVQVDKLTYRQSVEILDAAKGKLRFISAVSDEKGKTVTESAEFYISDIDKNTLVRKTSGKKLFISLTVNNNQKFIKHFKEDKTDGYVNNIEILMSSADAASELMELIKKAIPLVPQGSKAFTTAREALEWLKTNISEAGAGQSVYQQTFSYGEPREYSVTFTSKKTDQKSASTEETFTVSLPDINLKTLTVRVSGTQLAVAVATRSNDPYIKCSRNGEQQNYQDNFDIMSEDIEQARNIISALTAAVEKSKITLPDFGNLQKASDFIVSKTAGITVDKKTISQKITLTPGSGTKAVFSYTEPDSKGKAVEERFEFYLSDLDGGNIGFKVSGKKVFVAAVTANKTKFIRYFKDNNLQDFQSEADIYLTDIETARELAEAFKVAVRESAVKPLTWKSVNESVAFLAGSVTGETAGFKVNFSQVSDAPLYVRYVAARTDAKGGTSEQTDEFYPYMLDPASVKISSGGKYLRVTADVAGKKSYVRSFRDGKQQSFTDGVELMVSDARQARETADALRYLAGAARPEEKKWTDKQAAWNFIAANIRDMKKEGLDVKQKAELINNDPCRYSVKSSVTDDKGKTTEEIREFTLSDMNSQMTEVKVSGKNIEVVVTCRNKEKLVKAYKNGEQQAWGSMVEIGADDVQAAMDLAAALRGAIGLCGK